MQRSGLADELVTVLIGQHHIYDQEIEGGCFYFFYRIAHRSAYIYCVTNFVEGFLQEVRNARFIFKN